MPAWIAVVSTAYCLSGTMADGTGVRAGSVAHNGLPLGTHVTVSASPTQRRRYVVRDRIGWGTELDFWTPSCAAARAWGRRTVRLRVGWPKTYWRLRRLHAPCTRLGHLSDPHPARDHLGLDPGRRPFRLSWASPSAPPSCGWRRSRSSS